MNKIADEEKFAVALAKEACPLCGKLSNGPIIMNTRLTRADANKVKEYHNEVIGFTKKPCEECQDMMTKGILLIGVIEAKTDDPKNPYRSGNRWVVRKEFIERIFSRETAEKVITKGCCFFSAEAAVQLGFQDVNMDA